MDKFLSLLTTGCFVLFSLNTHAEPSVNNRLSSAVAFVNSINSMGILQKALQTENGFTGLKGPFPKAIVSGDSIIVEGAKYPLKVKSLSKGEFTLNGYVLRFDGKTPSEKMVEKIDSILNDKIEKSGLFQYLVPEAHAFLLQAAVVAMAVYVVGAIVVDIGCSVSDYGRHRALPYACDLMGLLWPIVAATMVYMAATNPTKARAPIASLPCDNTAAKNVNPEISDSVFNNAATIVKAVCESSQKNRVNATLSKLAGQENGVEPPSQISPTVRE